MAISRFGTGNRWVELASSTPTSGSTLTFSSINSGYSDLMLVWNQTSHSASNETMRVQFNADTGNNYSFCSVDTGNSGSPTGTARDTSIIIGYTGNPTDGPTLYSSGRFLIQGANQIYKMMSGWMAGGVEVVNLEAAWNSTDVINEIKITLAGTTTFSAGTYKILGRN